MPDSSVRRDDAVTIRNDTAANVVALLKDHVGGFRNYRMSLDEFALDEDLAARNVAGRFRLTRISNGIIARVEAAGMVALECQRCLRTFDQPFETSFSEEFRASVDVYTGAELESDDEDERFAINDNHELDIAEPLRQEILISLPMRPVCGDDCPGPDVLETGAGDDIDNRFAALAELLDND